MPERADRTIMDYIYNAQANTSPVGALVPLSDTWGWSLQMVATAPVSGNLFFQFTDFDAIDGTQFPFPANNMFGDDAFQVALSSLTGKRVGRAYDSVANTPKWMRVSWLDSASNASVRMFMALTLKHQ